MLIATPAPSHAGDIPTFAVDASWPKPLPNNWILGQVGGITVDAQGHIWVIHRPRSLTDDEKGAALTPPRSKCCVSAPPVLEFDADGNLLRSWGGPGEGYEWVGREHGIEVDEKGFVWVGGNADNDNAILKNHPSGARPFWRWAVSTSALTCRASRTSSWVCAYPAAAGASSCARIWK